MGAWEHSSGGIYIDSGASASLRNTIVAGNLSEFFGPDVYGEFDVGSSYNLIGAIDDSTGLDVDPNTQYGTIESPLDPMISPLADNGGPTLTHALLAGSPAIDAGAPNANGAPLTDQRGLQRILDGDGDNVARIDVGAYEFVFQPHPGDADLSGATDLSDFNIWNANKFRLGTDWQTADFNGDGVTDLSDFNIWNAHKFTLMPDPVPVDAILKEADSLDEAQLSETIAGDPAWIDRLAGQLERQRSPTGSSFARAAVDKLLATYW